MKIKFSSGWIYWPVRFIEWLDDDATIAIELPIGTLFISGRLQAIAFIFLLLGTVGLVAAIGIE